MIPPALMTAKKVPRRLRLDFCTRPLVAAMLGLFSLKGNVYSAEPTPPTKLIDQPPPSISNTATPLRGRLFFSAEQRQRIDIQRRLPEKSPTQNDEGEDAPPAEPEARLDGFIRRSDGQMTAWVNGKTRTALPADLAQQIKPEVIGNDTVRLVSRVPLSGAKEGTLDATKPRQKPVKRRAQSNPSTVEKQ